MPLPAVRTKVPLSSIHSQHSWKTLAKLRRTPQHPPPFYPSIPFPRATHTLEKSRALRAWGASLPSWDSDGSCGRLRSVSEEEAGLGSLSRRPPGTLPRRRSRRGGGPAYLLFSSSWVSSGWVFCPSRATSPQTVTFGRLRILFLKSFFWAEAAAGPPGPPRPRRPRGWGRGGGSKNSSRSPAEEPGGRRLAEKEDPRGGGGEGAGKERTAAPVLLSPPPRPPLHIGVPAPPVGGWLPGLGSRLIHSRARCYGPERVAEAAARWGTRPAPLGAAPAPGSSMCRCGWDPLPPPWGSLAPRPGTDRSSGPSSASSHRGAAD